MKNNSLSCCISICFSNLLNSSNNLYLLLNYFHWKQNQIFLCWLILSYNGFSDGKRLIPLEMSGLYIFFIGWMYFCKIFQRISFHFGNKLVWSCASSLRLWKNAHIQIFLNNSVINSEKFKITNFVYLYI